MFRITQRQYEIIMQQAQACYPKETGGFLGGREDTVLGVLPEPNKFLGDRTQTYGLTNEDMERAYGFFTKHNLQYFGVYHTHPEGEAFPSEQDLKQGQKYLFIIGLKDRYNPELRAFEVVGYNQVLPVEILVINNHGITVIDIKTGRPKLSENITPTEMEILRQMINLHIAGQLEYPKYDANGWDASSFSTFA